MSPLGIQSGPVSDIITVSPEQIDAFEFIMENSDFKGGFFSSCALCHRSCHLDSMHCNSCIVGQPA